MGSLGSVNILDTKIILRSKFSSAKGLFLKATLKMACAQMEGLKRNLNS
jgi:hypothetical protein